LSVRIAAPLVDANNPDDDRVARIVADQVHATIAHLAGAQRPAVVLVDHGSPQAEVGAVRDRVAAQLAATLGDAVRVVIAASMERRDGDAFDFNEPLLARALSEPPLGDHAGDVIVAPLFFSPGRHAGPGGDIETICRAAEARHRGLRVHIAPLVGEHPLLIDVLADRWREAGSS
jgi:sirohydrochlorin ferrochelatase